MVVCFLHALAPAVFGCAAIARGNPVAAQDEARGNAKRASEATGAGSLRSLLSLLPSTELDSAGGSPTITFGDMAAQLAAGGLSAPASIDDDESMRLWINASYPIAIADPFRRSGLELTRALIGFDVTDLDQTIAAGLPPDTRTLLRGRLDPKAIEVAREANGYRSFDVDGMTVASIGEDHEINLSNEINRIALARMNNAAFLPDGTLASTPTLALLKELIAVASGNASSVAEDKGVSLLISSLTVPLVSAILFSGIELAWETILPPDLIENDAVATEIATLLKTPEALPALAFGLVGISAGGPTIVIQGEEPVVDFSDATIYYRIVMSEPGSAAAAAPIVLSRFESMSSLLTTQPYSAIYTLREVSSLMDGDVLGVELQPAGGRSISIWSHGLFVRDLFFLAW